MWCACADAVRDTVGKCGSKPHWGSARFTPCDTPRSYRLRRPHRAAAPALAVAPSPQPVKTWRPIALSREKGEIVHTRLLRQNAKINEPSTVVFGARRAVLCAGRARSAPPPARRARGQHPADGHGHAVYITYVRRQTDRHWPVTLLSPGRTGHSFLQRAIRARANTDRSTLDSQLLLDCNKYYFDASRKIRYFCASVDSDGSWTRRSYRGFGAKNRPLPSRLRHWPTATCAHRRAVASSSERYEVCEVEGAEEEAEDGRDCEPGPYRPEGHCERYEAADGAYGSHGNGARTVVLPFARKFENVFDPQDEVAGHQAPAAEAGETNVEEEAAVRTCVTLWSILDQSSRRGL